jgi:Tfp pilus assembly protein PilZ
MPAKITITVSRDPAKPTTIKVEGHNGPGCQKLTEAVEAALGTTVSDTQTEEFDNVVTEQVQQDLLQ